MRKLVISLAALTAIATPITLAAAPANAESMADPSAQAGEHSTERYVVVTDGSAAPLASLNAQAADGADTYPNVGATVTELTPVEAAELDARRGVTVARDTRVSLVPDPGFTPKEEKANGAPMTTLEPDVAAMGYANSWGLDRIDQRTLPLSGTYTPNPGVGGGGVDVYVIDTGLATQHPEFQGRVGNGYDVVDGDSVPQECGSVPHGTHVAGTIASTLFGAAPQSTIHGVRVLDCDGAGYVSDVIAGMDWVVGERSRIGRTVVANMSLGGPYNSALNAATANMFRNGVVTVAAAGNEADNASNHSPGSTPEAITVAASTSNDLDASYSNYGSIIDLYAPGSDIWSTYAYDPSQRYRLSGTSMATPHVAGWAALYLGLHPDATPSQVRGGLVTSGTIGMINGVVGGTPNVLPYVGDLAGAPSPPSPPTGIAASRGDRSARVTWTAPSNGGSPVTGYTVTSSPGGITTTLPGDATSATLTGLANGTAYTFTVTATNAIGTSAASTSSNSVTPAGIPAAPSNADAARGDGQAVVNWTAPANNGSAITNYTITSAPGGITKTVAGDQTSATISGLTNGTGYTFTVKATNAIGDSSASATSNLVTPAAVPDAPTSVSATQGDKSAQVSWTAASGNGSPVTGYTITSAPGGVTKTVPGDQTSATVSGLTNGTGYTFTVKATNAVGNSPASAPSTAVTPSEAVVAFGQADLSVAENAGTVNLTVTRSGDTTVQSSVNYSRIAGTATAGTDFTLPAGTLTFQPGETTKTIPLTISNDVAIEAGETIVVSLDSPAAGTALTSLASMTVTISASDQRPDGLISTSASTGYVGNNVYNTTGAGQAKTVSARRTVTRTFYARVYNDGNVSNAIAIKGSAALAGSTVRYYSGSTNVTTAMRSASGWRVTLSRGAYKVVAVKITIARTASVGSYKSATVTSSWTGDGTRSDAVKAIVKVIR